MNYGQVSPGYGMQQPMQQQQIQGPNLAQPYQPQGPQQALSNNSETYSKSLFLLEPNVI